MAVVLHIVLIFSCFIFTQQIELSETIDCPPGTFVQGEGNSRKCIICPTETYSSSLNATSCEAYATCDFLPVSKDPTPTSDRECGMCLKQSTAEPVICVSIQTGCPSGTFGSGRTCRPCPPSQYSTNPQTRGCKPFKDCYAGEYVISEPNAKQDRLCASCPSSTFSNAINAKTCQTWSKCVDSFQIEAPTSTSDRLCISCEESKEFFNGTDCIPVTECTEMEYEAHPPTKTSDRRCQPITTECDPWHYISANATSTSDIVCSVCKTCSSTEVYVKMCNQSSSQDTECRPIHCPEGQFAEVHSDEFPFWFNCNNCSECSSQQNMTAECSLFSDTECRGPEDCGHDEFRRPWHVNCSKLTVCQDEQFQVQRPTLSSDRICQNWTKCEDNEIQLVPPTLTSDRKCGVCQAGKVLWNNTACEPCGSGTFVKEGSIGSCDDFDCQPGTYDHDLDPKTECQPCQNGTFQDLAGQTSCKPKTPCQDGFQEDKTQSLSLTSDRKCDVCPFGTFRYGDMQGCEKPQDCQPGSEVVEIPSPTRNRSCRKCDDDSYSSVLNGKCAVHAKCAENFIEISPPSYTSNRLCVPCIQDGDDKLAPETKSLLCNITAECDVGHEPHFYPSEEQTMQSKFTCEPCGNSTFKSSRSQLFCKAATRCRTDESERFAPTPTSDRVCEPCKQGSGCNNELCTPGQEAIGGCTDCPAGFNDHDQDPTTPCKRCPVGTYSPKGFSGNCLENACRPGTIDHDNDPATECIKCPGNQNQVVQLYYGQAKCNPALQCLSGPTKTAAKPNFDTVCDVCEEGKFYDTSKYVCQTITNCLEGEYQLEALEEGKNRRCEACAPEKFSTIENAEECKPTTKCYKGEYESTPPTPSSDRVCSPCKSDEYKDWDGPKPCEPNTCKLTEYILIPGNRTTKVTCQMLTTCHATEYEKKKPTSTSDRICGAQEELHNITVAYNVSRTYFKTIESRLAFEELIRNHVESLNLHGYFDVQGPLETAFLMVFTIRFELPESADIFRKSLESSSFVVKPGSHRWLVVGYYADRHKEIALQELAITAVHDYIVDHPELEDPVRLENSYPYCIQAYDNQAGALDAAEVCRAILDEWTFYPLTDQLHLFEWLYASFYILTLVVLSQVGLAYREFFPT